MARRLTVAGSNAIEEALLDLAAARQAQVSFRTIRVYADALQPFDEKDRQVALSMLGLEPRRRWEPAFPELGRVIATVKRTTRKRLALVLCGGCLSRHVYIDGDPERTMRECDCVIEYRALLAQQGGMPQ